MYGVSQIWFLMCEELVSFVELRGTRLSRVGSSGIGVNNPESEGEDVA